LRYCAREKAGQALCPENFEPDPLAAGSGIAKLTEGDNACPDKQDGRDDPAPYKTKLSTATRAAKMWNRGTVESCNRKKDKNRG